MRIGINLLLWTGHVTRDLQPVLEEIAATGFDGVEVPIFDATDPAHYRDLGKLLDDLGLARTVSSAFTGQAGNPVSPDEAEQAAARTFLGDVVNCAAELGADMVVGPMFQQLGQFTGVGPTEAELDRCATFLSDMVPQLEARGVTLALEPLNRFEAYLLNTAEQGQALCSRVGHPRVGVLYDTFHANIEEKDTVTALGDLHASGTLAHVHISENDRGTPGKGHAKIRETIHLLDALDYDGWLTIEAFGKAVPELAAATRVWRDFFADPSEVVHEGHAYIRDCLESA